MRKKKFREEIVHRKTTSYLARQKFDKEREREKE